MQTLDAKAFDRARRFMLGHARPLDRARYCFLFEGGPAADVREALRAFANPDGGFGNGLEPDFLLPDSSPMATTHAFHALREIDAGDDCELVQGAMRYLVARWDASRAGWQDVPDRVNEFPHAPWWNRGPGAAAQPEFAWGNPDADAIAAFHEHPELVADGFLDELTPLALARLEKTPAPCDRYIALCFLRLADAAPARVRAPILARLRDDAREILDLDPQALEACEFQPWWLAETSDAPLADALRPEIQAGLDREIARQHADGYWEPRWTWGGAYPEAWERARLELRGSETLRTLIALRGWGRIEACE